MRELTGSAYAERVREQMCSGVANGVRSTQAFFNNGRRHDDYWVADRLSAAINDAPIVEAL